MLQREGMFKGTLRNQSSRQYFKCSNALTECGKGHLLGISKPKGNVNSDSVEKDTHVPDLCAVEKLARNAYQEAKKQQIFAHQVQKQNTHLTSLLEMYKERVRILENINKDINYLNEFLEVDERAKHYNKQAQSQLVRDQDIIRDLEKQRYKLDLDVKNYKQKNEELHSILKRQMSEKKDTYHDTILNLEAKLKKNVDLILKLGNYLQGMFMLGPKPLSVYDQQLKHGLGYPNPYTLKQAISKCPKLYVAPNLLSTISELKTRLEKVEKGMNATSRVRRPMSRDSHVAHSVLDNSKKEAKITFFTNSRTSKSSETTFVAPKTRFSEKEKQSKTLDTTSVVSKSKINVESASKAKDKFRSFCGLLTVVVQKLYEGDRSLLEISFDEFLGTTVHFGNDIFCSQSQAMAIIVHGYITICQDILCWRVHVVSKSKIDVESASKAKDKVVQIVPWVVDSGCSKHMTGDRSLLRNFIKKFIGTVRFRNDNFAAITCYGDYIHGNITICHVYYVKGDDLLIGGRESNLYTISISVMAASSPVCLMSKETSTKSWLWHRRLSHLNFGTINDLTRLDLVDGLPKFKYGKDHLCCACERGKSKKASHPPKLVPSDHSKLELLHMDLCGPMRTASINGKKYILVIVDDFSRYTWVYFLRSKDETPEIIKKFIAQDQLNYKAKDSY
ncbi:integrase, catalytic region, zinc finger, CCHC-type containing protein [Tanacetum coccineum]